MRDSVADVLATECGSLALHAFIDGKSGGKGALDDVLWRHASELGWLAAGIPEELGGVGLGLRGLAVLNRELGSRTAPGPFLSTLCAAQTLVDCADAAAREKYLPRIASGELAVCVLATPLGDQGGH